jgi:hypothetical protein
LLSYISKRHFSRLTLTTTIYQEEERLGEGVELGEGVAALGPQRLGLIQDRRNPLLLRQRREGDGNLGNMRWPRPEQRASYARNRLHELRVELVADENVAEIWRVDSFAAEHDPLTRRDEPSSSVLADNPRTADVGNDF